MNPETIRIATQLRHAFAGQPWHGPPLSELLADVTPEQAVVRPIPGTHNIQELVLHIDIWLRAALCAVQGIAMPKLYGTPDFYYLFHGIVQHSLYHAGQIALLRSANRSAQGVA